VFFENVRCTQCDRSLAYLPDTRRLSAIEPVEVEAGPDGEPSVVGGSAAVFKAVGSSADGQRYRLCANSIEHEACNWAVPEGDASRLCESCRLNDVIPDLSKAGNRAAWKKLESAKRRLFYSLRMFELPIESREERPEGGLVFSFMEDSVDGKQKVFTGHSDGAITINIAEADDPFREKLRTQL
jgi:hypothetical protein